MSFPKDVKARMDHTIKGDPLLPVMAVSTYEEQCFVEVAVEHCVGRGVRAGRIMEDLHRAFSDPADWRQFQVCYGCLVLSLGIMKS